MKNVIRLLALSVLAAVPALSTSAQQPAASPAQGDTAKVCTDLYGKWRENYKGNADQQKTAYEAGKEYLSKCPNDEYVSYVQKWVPKYEAAVQGVQLQSQYDAAVKAGDWKNIINYGKQLAAKDPENLTLYLNLAVAGSSSKDKALFPESINAARKAIQLVEAGKADAFTPEQWKAIPFASNKTELISFLNYTLAAYAFDTAPAEAASNVLKAVQAEGRYKSDPNAYYLLALAYQKAEYEPMAKDYSDNCAGKDLTDECKLKLDKLNLVVDRVIDALARSTALTTDAAAKAKRMQELETFYKFRNNDQTAGLPELVASIQSKPLLLKENQTLPTPAPTPTPTPSTSTTPSETTGNTATAPAPTTQPAPASTAKPATGTTSTTKPADTTPPKPAPKP